MGMLGLWTLYPRWEGDLLPFPQAGQVPHRHIPAAHCCLWHGAKPHLSPPWAVAASQGGAAPRWLSPGPGVPTARAGKWGQLPDLRKQFWSSLLPPPPKEAAEILLSPVLLHLSCKNRKNPTALAGTSLASE